MACVRPSPFHRALGALARDWRALPATLEPYLVQHGAHHLLALGQRAECRAFLEDLDHFDRVMEFPEAPAGLAATWRVLGEDDAGVSAYLEQAVAAGEAGVERLPLVQVLMQLTAYAGAAGEYGPYARTVEFALPLAEDLAAEDPQPLAGILNSAVVLANTRGDVERAVAWGRRALAISIQTLPEGHSNIAASYMNLALSLHLMDAKDEAREAIDKALHIYLERDGPTSSDVADALEALSFWEEQFGAKERSRALDEQVLGIRRNLFPADHPRVLSSLRRLADWEVAAGELPNALSRYEEVLELERRALGPHHRDVGTTMEHLSTCLLRANQLERARAAMEGSVDIERRSFPSGSEALVQRLQTLSNIHRRDGQLDTAEALGREALDMSMSLLPWAAAAREQAGFTLGRVLQLAGKLEEARDVLLETRAAELERRGGADDSDTGSTLKILGEVNIALGDVDAGREQLERVVDLWSAAHGAEDSEVLSILEALSELR